MHPPRNIKKGQHLFRVFRFISNLPYYPKDMLVLFILPPPTVGDGFDLMGNSAPGLFGGLQPVAPGQLLFGVLHEASAVGGVGLYGDAARGCGFLGGHG